MSMVNGNDGYNNIFGKPKPLTGVLGAVDKFVSSPVFPMLAGGIVGMGAGAYFGAGAAATTAVKAAPSLIGALTASSAPTLFPTGQKMTDPNPISFTGATNPDQSTSNTQLTGNVPTAGTAQLPAQPVIVMPSSNTGLYLAIAGIAYLLLKKR